MRFCFKGFQKGNVEVALFFDGKKHKHWDRNKKAWQSQKGRGLKRQLNVPDKCTRNQQQRHQRNKNKKHY